MNFFNCYVCLFVCFISLLSQSCDNRLDEISNLNTPPIVKIKVNNDLYTEFTDSIRISFDNAKFFYNVEIDLQDEDMNLKQCKVILDTNKINSYYNQQKLFYQTLRVDQQVLPISFLPKKMGLSSISFELEDKFNSKSIAMLNLFVFDNLLPEAVLTFNKLSEFEIEFDASKSFDKDQKYGGKIVAYNFTINGVSFSTPQPKVKNIFPQKGAYIVTLSVTDNNNATSNEIELRINI